MVWQLPEIIKLSQMHNVNFVRVCQCMYGLRFPDSLPGHFCKKETLILTNAPLQCIALMCNHGHVHDHAIGAIYYKKCWQRRTALAGAYPVRLCRDLAVGAQSLTNMFP